MLQGALSENGYTDSKVNGIFTNFLDKTHPISCICNKTNEPPWGVWSSSSPRLKVFCHWSNPITNLCKCIVVDSLSWRCYHWFVTELLQWYKFDKLGEDEVLRPLLSPSPRGGHNNSQINFFDPMDFEGATGGHEIQLHYVQSKQNVGDILLRWS